MPYAPISSKSGIELLREKPAGDAGFFCFYLWIMMGGVKKKHSKRLSSEG
jgi:hypothetical protein